MLAAPALGGVAGLGLAFVAGLVSIAAPCSWCLIPAYLAYLSGVVAGDTTQTRRVMGASALFVLGFAIVFTALGASASFLGSLLLRHQPLLIKVAGAFVIVMGLASLGVLRIPFLYKEKRFNLNKIRSGPAGAVTLGMAFAFGWTPCIGPVLGAVLTVAASTETASKGALLLFMYSLGLGLPFLAFAYFYSRAGRTFKFVRRHGRSIERVSGALLVAIGVLLVTGAYQRLFNPLAQMFARNHWFV
ncbi:MAG: cytochrome c biogenesis protein CcdA [Actinomycetota bacterium]